VRHIKGQDHVQEQLNKAHLKPPLLPTLAILACVVFVVCLLVGIFSLPSIPKYAILVGAVCIVVFAICLSLMGIPARQVTLKRLLSESNHNDEVGKLQAGVDGERAVAHTLDVLDGRWTLFSGVVLKGMYGDIDQVLVGPSGIFAIEAKHWSGSIHYDSSTDTWSRLKTHGVSEAAKDPARQIVSTSAVLRKVVGRTVHSCVVFTHPSSNLSGKHPGVAILTLPTLLPWIRSQDGSLSPSQVADIEQTLKKHMRR
jgi:hypothetical protein